MIETIVIAPEYLSFYIAGSRQVDIPVNHDKRGILATYDCITVPCTYWFEGDTKIELMSSEEVYEKIAPNFDQYINTSSYEFILFDANEPEIAKILVPTIETRIRIWINHPTFPDEIRIAWG